MGKVSILLNLGAAILLIALYQIYRELGSIARDNGLIEFRRHGFLR